MSATINVVAGPKIGVQGGIFGAGLCLSDVDEFQCQLKASAGVAMSNDSTVQLNEYPPTPPLWEATLVAQAGGPAVGDSLTVEVILSYIDSNQTYAINQTAQVQVKGCPG